MGGKTDEVPAGLLKREGCVFSVRVRLPGGVYGRICTHEHVNSHAHIQFMCTPLNIRTLHLVSITEMGAACQLCPIPLLLTGNARGAGQTSHAQDTGGALTNHLGETSRIILE